MNLTKLRSLPWSRLVLGLAALGMTFTIIATVLAPSPTEPRAEDVADAARVVTPSVGVDERFARPEGTFVSGNGVIEPADRETKVSAEVAGRVSEVRVKEGDRVAAGDVLVVLDHAVEDALLAAAEADVAAAQADLSRLRAGTRAEDLRAAEHDAASAAARAAQSVDAYTRQSALAVGGHVTAEALERARLQAEVDAELSAQAASRLALARAGSRREDVAAAQARLAGTEARRDEARARLDQRTVRAPIAGEVLQVLVRPGEQQQPGGAEPLVVMGDTSTLRVRFDLDERDIGRVTVGGGAKVRAIAFAGRDFTAKVVEVGRRMGRKNIRTDDPVERNDTKILEVVLTLDEPGPLVVGQRVVVYVEASEGQG